ncbi:MAG TPA: SRPBCC domain-containing protein [Labilithrix sp.]|nr:SRPBCC domain-containing protein [Labilithrix sp.]
MSAGPGDSSKVSVFVRVSPEDAFDVFTREIDLWWKHGPQYRIAGRRRGALFIEGGVGGRLFETFELSTGSKTIEVGMITDWDPPTKLALEWRGVNFKPHEKTFVEVTFVPSNDGTLVTVRHYGWSALPDDHPARHGLTGPAFSRMMGMWWGTLMTSLREHVAERST